MACRPRFSSSPQVGVDGPSEVGRHHQREDLQELKGQPDAHQPLAAVAPLSQQGLQHREDDRLQRLGLLQLVAAAVAERRPARSRERAGRSCHHGCLVTSYRQLDPAPRHARAAPPPGLSFRAPESQAAIARPAERDPPLMSALRRRHRGGAGRGGAGAGVLALHSLKRCFGCSAAGHGARGVSLQAMKHVNGRSPAVRKRRCRRSTSWHGRCGLPAREPMAALSRALGRPRSRYTPRAPGPPGRNRAVRLRSGDLAVGKAHRLGLANLMSVWRDLRSFRLRTH
jgi:hypothetical protein